MTNHIINDQRFSEIDIDTFGETWHLTATGTVTSSLGIFEESGASNNRIQVDGQIFADEEGIQTTGTNTHIQIGESGAVFAFEPVEISGTGADFRNQGLIVSVDDAAVFTTGTNGSIENSGRIFGTVGVETQADGNDITNDKTGVIRGSEEAIVAQTTAGQKTTVDNHGSIIATGGAMSVEFGDGDDTLVSNGTITGNISLGGGDNTVDLRGGVFHGMIIGGSGEDTLWTDNAQNQLIEDASGGEDIVNSTVTYTLNDNVEELHLIGKADIDGTGNDGFNVIIGSVGDNVLRGMGGNDALQGGKGNDKLFGGDGSDEFFFHAGSDRDTVEDFQKGMDSIFLLHWNGIATVHDVMTHAHDMGDNVVIEAGHDSITLHDLHKADLGDVDFFFQQAL